MKLNDFETVEKIQIYIEENLTDEIQISQLCEQFGINRVKIQRLFKEAPGDTVNEYIIKQRMYHVAEKLISTANSIRHTAGNISGNRVTFYKHSKDSFIAYPTNIASNTVRPQPHLRSSNATGQNSATKSARILNKPAYFLPPPVESNPSAGN